MAERRSNAGATRQGSAAATAAHGDALSQLGRSLVGIDGALDRDLNDLDRLLAGPAPEDRITAQVERIADHLMALNLRTRLAAGKRQADCLLDVLDNADLPSGLAARRASLATRLAEHPDAAPEETLQEQVLQLVAEAIGGNARPGLLSRLFASRGDRAAQHRATRVVTAAPEARIPDGARDALVVLIGRLVLPESAGRDARALGQRLAQPVPLSDLTGIVTALADLVERGAREENERLGRFLETLSGRIDELAAHLAHSRETDAESGEDRAQLDAGVRENVRDMQHDIGSSDSLTELRRRLESHLDRVVRHLDTFMAAEARRRRESEDRAARLQSRLEQTEAECAQLQRNLLQQHLRAQVDPLTRLANREAYDRQLAHEYTRWQRGGAPLALLFADIDRFKRINDRFGHRAGDDVLRAVAGTLRECLGADPLVARYGGEEFVILMPGHDAIGAAAVAEDLRKAVAARDFTAQGQPVQVTISFGVAQFTASDRPEDVLERADRALYQAKHGGRDRVVTATGADPHGEDR